MLKLNTLKNLRTDLKLKQSDIANTVGITQQAYSYIETNQMKPSLETAIKISEYFNKPIEELFSRNYDKYELSNEMI
jgi:putative transcriptional regulator